VLMPTAGTMSYPLASGLAAGEHDALLYKRTEAFFTTAQFLGFMVAGGQILDHAFNTQNRRIELIGDSITCGYGDEGMGPTCPFTNGTENEYLAYGALTARALGAEQVTLAWSGKGVYRNYDGTMTEPVPVLYDRTIATSATSSWDFKSEIPDAVIVNLGTNDFAQGDPGSGFVSAYDAFVKKIRGHYPTATIFLAVGPMLGDPSLTTARGYVQGVVSTETQAGDTRIAYVEFAQQDIAADGAGCDYHPSLATHQKMATVLTAAIKGKLGW
jgi:lysophospholipase L1-like esterase